MVENHFVIATESTNILLKKLTLAEKLPEFFAVRTAFQSAGKGQIGNSWEAERSKNLLFSMVLYPHHIAIHEQFIISQLVSVAIVNVLQNHNINSCIKWPNDIYVGNKKLGGILIENSLRGAKIDRTIVGIGLNVNQKKFKSNAPNPISICQILDKKLSVKTLFLEIVMQLKQLYLQFDMPTIKSEYQRFLFRNSGFYAFKIPNGEIFEAKISAIGDDGMLSLKMRNGDVVGFYFKEVEFVL